MQTTKIKVVLADDETIILNGLCKILKELSDIAVVCGTATDGKQLQQLVEQEHPDLVITDICMPQLSGLDVIQKIQSVKPRPEIVIISGYKNFEYAQSAMKYGVSEYLLKPIDPKELLALVRRLHQEILKKKSINFLEEPVPDTDILQDAGTFYQILVARCETVEESFLLENLIADTIPDQCYYFKYHSELCVVFSFPTEKEADQSAFQYAEDLLANVSADYAIGDLSQGLNGISKSYASACRILELAFFFDEKKVLSNADQAVFYPKPEDSLNGVLDDLCTYIRHGDHAAAVTELDRLAEVIMRASGGVRDIAIIHFYSAADKIRSLISDTALLDIYSPDNILAFVKECKNFRQIKEFLKNMISDTIEQIGAKKETQINFEIQMVMDYIQDNFNKNITLESMANLVHKNAYYFSAFFKKCTNENFKDYVMRVRMEKALEELKNTDKTINVIAMETGFIDPHYFSKVFKKYFGFTASSVRKKPELD